MPANPHPIEMLTLGLIATNCYIIGDDATHEAAIIDPAADAPTILAAVAERGWTVREILLTHAHFDHVLALGEIKAATSATIRLHAADLPLLQDLPNQMRHFFNQEVPPPPAPDILVNEGDTFTVGGIPFEVRFTPGHTLGHVSYVDHADAVVFSGDCLFNGAIGRYDLPGGDRLTLLRSITTRLLTLPDDYTVAAGHMQTTTIGRERASNPYLLDFLEMGE
jgi:glyoxylase-like metal-dependent hydrolase (beta-lactamase superfamily II)